MHNFTFIFNFLLLQIISPIDYKDIGLQISTKSGTLFHFTNMALRVSRDSSMEALIEYRVGR